MNLCLDTNIHKFLSGDFVLSEGIKYYSSKDILSERSAKDSEKIPCKELEMTDIVIKLRKIDAPNFIDKEGHCFTSCSALKSPYCVESQSDQTGIKSCGRQSARLMKQRLDSKAKSSACYDNSENQGPNLISCMSYSCADKCMNEKVESNSTAKKSTRRKNCVPEIETHNVDERNRIQHMSRSGRVIKPTIKLQIRPQDTSYSSEKIRVHQKKENLPISSTSPLVLFKNIGIHPNNNLEKNKIASIKTDVNHKHCSKNSGAAKKRDSKKTSSRKTNKIGNSWNKENVSHSNPPISETNSAAAHANQLITNGRKSKKVKEAKVLEKAPASKRTLKHLNKRQKMQEYLLKQEQDDYSDDALLTELKSNTLGKYKVNRLFLDSPNGTNISMRSNTPFSPSTPSNVTKEGFLFTPRTALLAKFGGSDDTSNLLSSTPHGAFITDCNADQTITPSTLMSQRDANRIIYNNKLKRLPKREQERQRQSGILNEKRSPRGASPQSLGASPTISKATESPLFNVLMEFSKTKRGKKVKTFKLPVTSNADTSNLQDDSNMDSYFEETN